MVCPSCHLEIGRLDNVTCPACGKPLVPGLTDGLLAGRYELLALVGSGGMGTVFKARDCVLDEIVAVKILRSELATDPRLLERFRSEIKLARKITHRNVIRIHDYGEDGPVQFISMEYVDGMNMREILSSAGRLPPERAYAVLTAVAAGLEAIHEQKIVHRDLKTPNIMEGTNGVIRLMDFGIAKEWSSTSPVTSTLHLIGTPDYMSPEQIEGRPVDARSDLYTLGIVAFELFTGTPPFHADTPGAIIAKHLKEEPPLERGGEAGIPAPLEGVLRRLLAKNPDARYGNARDVLDALARAEVDTLHPRPLKPGSWLRRSYAWGLALGGVAILAVLLRQAAVRDHGAESATISPSSLAAHSGASVVPVPSPKPTSAAPTTDSVVTTQSAAPDATTRPLLTERRPVPGSPRADARSETSPRRAAPNSGGAKKETSSSLVATEESAAHTGLLQISAHPWAQVEVDGKVVGTTPMTPFTVSVGQHVVTLTHPSYQPVEKTVIVGQGATVEVRVDFKTVGVRR